MRLVVSIAVGYHYGMNLSLSGKRALVVGGTSGIGAVLSTALVSEGAVVTAVGRGANAGDIDLSRVKMEKMDLESALGREKTLELARDTDILCIVWGPFLQKPLHETTAEDWERLASVNLGFPGSLVSAALPSMRESAWGRILLFGGTRTDETRGFLTNAAYGAVKTGLSSLAKSVSLAYANEGISCNVLCPGFVDTGSLGDELARSLAVKSPDGALITREELVETAIFMLKRPLLNGLALRSDKGWEPKFI